MREHPIPQDISSYRFHIIGSMTLKQFAEVAIGCILAFVIYKTNLIDFIKFPLAAIALGLGAAAAFLPIEERPLDHWIITFFKVLYKPTQFYWKKSASIPEPFLHKTEDRTNDEPETDLSPVRRQRIKEYMRSVSQESDGGVEYSEDEQKKLSSVLSLFLAPLPKMKVADPKPIQELKKPNLSVRVRRLRGPDSHDRRLAEKVVYSAPPAFIMSSASPIQVGHTTNQLAQKKSGQIQTEQIAQNVVVPNLERLKFENKTNMEEEIIINTQNNNLGEQVFFQQNPQEVVNEATSSVAQNSNLPFPVAPTEPNKVVGMVLTPNNELVPDAIVEIQTTDGTIARAVKTNALGQFFVTTPLGSGEYTLVVEKEPLSFEPKSISLIGDVVQPLEIRSQN